MGMTKAKLDESIAIGIDLGTTNTCAFYFIDGRLESLENAEGSRQTPSQVYFTPTKTLVGECAKKMNCYEQGKGVQGIKRLLGRPYAGLANTVINQITRCSLLIREVGKKLTISFKMGKEQLDKTPQEICAIILKKVRQDVEDKLGCTITKVVITVPAYFDTNQRQATLQAAKEAGLVVLKLLNEPNASALNFYYATETADSGHYSLVYDLGGGTFDVSIIKRVGDNVDVLAVDGDSHLGGNDFDELIADYVCTELEKTYGCYMRKDKQGMNELQILCEEAKRDLSFMEETFIVLKGFVPSSERNVKITLTRQKLEELILAMLKTTIDITDRCLQGANIDKTRIDDVIMAGGSSRIPKVSFLLSEYFGGRKPAKFLNPDESVAKGAALQAAMLSEHPRQKITTIQIVDVVPLSLGTDSLGDIMKTLIPKNTPIPATDVSSWVNVLALQKRMAFTIFEGERLQATANVALGGKLRIDITPKPPQQSKVLFTINVDTNGIITCTAKDKDSGVVEKVKLKGYTRGIRSDNEIKLAITDALNCEDEDAQFLKLAYSRRALFNYSEAVLYNMTTRNLQDEYKRTFDLCTEINKTAFDLKNKEKIDQCFETIKKECEPLFKTYNFELY